MTTRDKEPNMPDGSTPTTEKDRIVPLSRVLRHTFDPWSGKCGCGAGPFSVAEHRDHVTSPADPKAGA